MEHLLTFESLPNDVHSFLRGTVAEKNAAYETFGAVSPQAWERFIHTFDDIGSTLLVSAVLGKDLRLFRLLVEKRVDHQVRP